MFNLRRPCKDCPFRKGMGELYQLSEERINEIKNQSAFQCHKTVDYSDGPNGRAGKNPNQCAGLMAILHRDNTPNTIMQVAERLINMDFSDLDPNNEAYDTWKDALEAHK